MFTNKLFYRFYQFNSTRTSCVKVNKAIDIERNSTCKAVAMKSEGVSSTAQTTF